MRGFFAFVVAMLIAALPLGAHAEQWLIVKDKDGKCAVMKTKPGTPVIVSGPYATKDEARKAVKAGDCKPVEKKAEDKKSEGSEEKK